MNYLTGSATQANVAVLWVVARWLARVEAARLDQLSAALRPASVVLGADDALRASLATGVDFDLFSLDADGRYRLAESVTSADIGDHRSFRRIVCRLLLARAVAELECGRSPSDVALALAWLLSLDPMRPPAWGWEHTETWAHRDGAIEVVRNSTQWRVFRRWSIALGMAEARNPDRLGGPATLSPDPSRAVAAVLKRLPPSMPGNAFLEALAVELPCLDTGALEPAATALGVPYSARSGATIGPALGYALTRLDRRGVLRLVRQDDASTRVSYRVSGRMDSFDRVEVRRG